MRKHVRASALIGLLALAGCDLATDPDLIPIQEAEVAELAGAAANADAARGEGLSLESLLRRMHEAIRASGGNAKAQELLDASSALAKQARDAAVAGDKARALSLANDSQTKLLEAVVLVLGPGVARDAVAAARAILTDLKAMLAGKALPDKVAARLAAAERRLAEGETALAQGKNVEALSIALAVAGEVRGLAGQDPIADAARAVEEAAAWLNRARTAAGASPPAEVAAALAKAQQLLAQAQDALKAGDRNSALKLATESSAISRKLAEPVRETPDAAKAIEEAAALLGKAKATVGPNPSAEAAAILAKAELLLAQARDALEAGDSGAALKLAVESSSLSRRLLEPPRPPADDAARAIEEAAAWLNRARTAAGPNPPTEIASLLARAAQLLEEAQKALKAGDAGAAFKLAAESTAISKKLATPTPPPPDPAKLIEEAAALLTKARAAVGPSPSAEVAALLAKAELLHKQAQDALKSGDRAAAVSLATQSAEISRKLITTTRTTG
jgi:hypothetical protein